jgi:hypothetical protein
MEIWGGIGRETGDTSAAWSGVSNACGGSKILTFLFRSRLVCYSLLHLRGSWKVNCANYFAMTEFYEVRELPLCSEALTALGHKLVPQTSICCVRRVASRCLVKAQASYLPS